jgi:putative transcriptional regulator
MGKVQLKLDKYLISIGVTRYRLSDDTGIRYPTIDKYYKNKVVRYDNYILAKICDALHCDINDIIEYVE